ncbi:MAG TPA: hypothetical protein EYN69_04845, partial [Flavobacteriales bacterium]|nr:hypothetical protein [Flavobacteriales bacterium]
MGIKDLFGGKKSNKIVTKQHVEQLTAEVESKRFIEKTVEARQKFVPKIDFSDPKNFARYGSAEKYYEDSIQYIFKTYPYDGSFAEKTKWHTDSTYLDNWFFKNEYPRATGYLDLNTNPGVAIGSDNGGEFLLLPSPQYIQLTGGPHPHVDKPYGSAAPDGVTNKISETFPEKGGRANLWNDSEEYFKEIRRTNLYLNGEMGSTVEFWLKSDVDPSDRVALFDLWDGGVSDTRMTIEHTPNAHGGTTLFDVTYRVKGEGTLAGTPVSIGDENGLGSPAAQSVGGTPFSTVGWNHYAFTFKNSGNNLEIILYINGEFNESIVVGTEVDADALLGLRAHINSYIAAPPGGAGAAVGLGWGSHPFSYDEFRFWKTARNHKEIGRYWFSQFGGGTNSRDVKVVDRGNVDLGVYYKFNEGLLDDEHVDQRDGSVLDYSGRISNGIIVNYALGTRNLGSAINEADNEVARIGSRNTEFRDPILYPDHPDIVSLLEEKRLTGTTHDQTNNAGIYHTMPDWITEEDNGNLLNLTQVVSNYFDQLHLQIEELPRIKDIAYDSPESGDQPYHFARDLLDSVGFVAPDIFVDSTIIEELASRSEDEVFDHQIQEIKNLIYQNIYNNLVYIYKSKGTEKAFRNLIRCFGVDDELIKINLYADEVTYKFEDNVRYTSIQKNYVDFNNPDRNESVVYQFADPSNTSAVSYIPASDSAAIAPNNFHEHDFVPVTIEAEVIFPKFLEYDHPSYLLHTFGFTKAPQSEDASILGIHHVDVGGPTDSFRPAGVDDANFRLLVQRTGRDDKDAFFILTSTSLGGGFRIKSPTYKDVYDNERWNFAIRLRVEDKYWDGGVAPVDLTSSTDPEYVLEFYGVNATLDEIEKEFTVSVPVSSAEGRDFFENAKRLYVGAAYSQFEDNTTLELESNVKVSSVRYWVDYLDDETIKAHAKDASSAGRMNPLKPAYFTQMSFVDDMLPAFLPDGVTPMPAWAQSIPHGSHIPQIKTLVFDWDFATVETADGGSGAGPLVSDAKFIVEDIASGSIADNRWDWIGDIVERQYTGQGDFFLPNDIQAVDRDYVFSARKQLPESLSSSNTVNILRQDDDIFPKG